MSFSFSRDHRLLNAAEFKQVFDTADIKVSHKHLLILAHRTTRETPRLGLVIAKKNIRHAVNRNRVKRMMRETFRLNQTSLEKLDIVVLARKGLDTLSNRQLQNLLEKQWLRIRQRSESRKPSPSRNAPGQVKAPASHG
ncbi:ribonuclease P protein component [Kistimonas asteriae]|uniref:ribonuclease P protein component n=1 Tax=Kistimonas asteriae TaxID=517724 RepID=UPI001BAC3DAE